MTFEFDFDNIETVEFGVGNDQEEGRTFCFVQVDGDVQNALKEMASTTKGKMISLANTLVPQQYQPSEKHGSEEYLYLPLNDNHAQAMYDLHTANNLPTDANSLRDTTKLFCVFYRYKRPPPHRLTQSHAI